MVDFHSRPGRSGLVAHRSLAPLAFAVAIAALALAPACARARRQTTPSDNRATVSTAPVPLAVDNRSTRDVVIFAERGSLRQRVGNVPGLSRANLRVPAAFTVDVGGFALVVTPIGGGEGYRSDPVVVQPGERLVLSLQPRLPASALRIE